VSAVRGGSALVQTLKNSMGKQRGRRKRRWKLRAKEADHRSLVKSAIAYARRKSPEETKDWHERGDTL